MIQKLLVSPDGKYLFTGMINGDIGVFTLKTRNYSPKVQFLNSDQKIIPDYVKNVGFTDDGFLLTAGTSGLFEWDLKYGDSIKLDMECPKTLRMQTAIIDPLGKYIAISGDATIYLWDIISGNIEEVPINVSSNLSFSPDGEILIIQSYPLMDSETYIQFWDINAKKFLDLPLFLNAKNVVFSPSKKYFAYRSFDDSINIYDLELKDTSAFFRAGGYSDLVFTPDENYLVWSAENNSIYFWNIDENQQEGIELIGHSDTVEKLVISPDGNYLISNGYMDKVIVWDLESYSKLLSFGLGAQWVDSISVSYDSLNIAITLNTAPKFGTSSDLILINLDFNHWISLGCDIVNRNLTQEEWTQFVGEVEYQQTCPGK